jgi:ABC-type transport system substrate-binding protein
VIEYLTFNFSDARFEVNPQSVNDSEQFRRALATAIDRPQILADTGIPWFSGTPGMLVPTTSGWSVYDTAPAPIPDLPDGAASVLSTTGNGDYRIRIGDTLASTFAAVGVSYTPTYVDSQLFFGETMVEGAYDVGMWAWISDGGYASPLGLMQFLDPASSPPDGNFGSWGSGTAGNEATRRFSEIVAEASTTFDPQRFHELVAEAEQILVSELPLIPLFHHSSAIGVWADTVAGVVNNGSRADFTWNVETWRRIDE